MIVLHYTAMSSAQAALKRLCDPALEVSAHYLIASDGSVASLVREEARAWHAGAGSWGGVADVNSRSIGIELANSGTEPFAEAQMSALERLLGTVMERWSIAPERVIGHSDVAPERKSDPGPRFDWRRLARQGLSVWPEPREDGNDFRADARKFGYPDLSAEPLLRVFRFRFRPWAVGEEDAIDRALISDLANRFPVDQDLPTS